MRSGIVAVWDQDREYAGKLTEYLRHEQGLQFRAVCYTQEENLIKAVENGQVSAVLAGRPVAQSSWLKNSDTLVLTLTEERETGTDKVYKYQSAYEVFRLLLSLQQTQGEETGARSATLRGIYSPVGGCRKTSFGLALGRELSENSSCLFVSLDICSGFRSLFDRRYPADLSDLLDSVSRGENILARLTSAVQPFGRLHYIPPVIWPEDIRQLEDHIPTLLRRLAGCGIYEEIVLDVGSGLALPERILMMCDVIYRPEQDDACLRARLFEYDHYLQTAGYDLLMKRIIPVTLPGMVEETQNSGIDQWGRWASLRPAVQRLLEEEKNDGWS